MDATLKQRMWKVAIAHFAVTAFVWVNFAESVATGAWQNFWWSVLEILQPTFALMAVIMKVFLVENWNSNLTGFLTISFVFAIPLWSICFGWIFVKLDNWLNHFPVLGRKVF